MISTEEMIKAEGKRVKIIFNDGEIWQSKFCNCYHWKQDEDEENVLEFGNVLINQSEIKSIEILN